MNDARALRPVIVLEWKRPAPVGTAVNGPSKLCPMFEGRFHEWTTEREQPNDRPGEDNRPRLGSWLAAIVEKNDGTIVLVACDRIRFLDSIDYLGSAFKESEL
jgi:hypothetical protein